MTKYVDCAIILSKSCSVGSYPIPIGQIFKIIIGAENSVESRIFWYVRFPRTVGCFVAGGALAVSGAVIQNVLANKLSSPSTIGVNSGAGLAVTLCTAFGIYGGFSLALFSFLGAFAAVMLVSIASRKWGASRGTVLLIGVALNSILNSASQTVKTFIPDVAMVTSDFVIGDFSSVTYQKLAPALIITVVSIIILFTLSNELELLSLGDDNARGLGLNIKFIRTLFLILAAMLAECAVMLAGLLSFVGLIVPHIVRKFSGSSAKTVLPMCGIFGGGFVMLCDLIARTAFSPYEIPVGIIMSFVGAPFFVFVLVKSKGGHSRA